MENRLLNGILATKGGHSMRSLHQQSPEGLMSITTPHYDDGLLQTFPSTTSIKHNDSNQWPYDLPRDMDLNHLNKRRCLCHHELEPSAFASLTASAPGSVATASESTMSDSTMNSSASGRCTVGLHQPFELGPLDWNMRTFDTSSLFASTAAMESREFDFALLSEEQVEGRSAAFTLPQTPPWPHNHCDGRCNNKNST